MFTFCACGAGMRFWHIFLLHSARRVQRLHDSHVATGMQMYQGFKVCFSFWLRQVVTLQYSVIKHDCLGNPWTFYGCSLAEHQTFYEGLDRFQATFDSQRALGGLSHGSSLVNNSNVWKSGRAATPIGVIPDHRESGLFYSNIWWS